MISKTAIALTGAAVCTWVSLSGASAADLGAPVDQQPLFESTPARAVAPGLYEGRAFYVRGDVGIGANRFSGFSQEDLAANGGQFVSSSIGDSPYLGVGFGWKLNSRFRFDLTGEYRGTAQVKALDNVTGFIDGPPLTNIQANTLYSGNLTSLVGLVNGYLDLGTWRGFTPYVGAGVGFARNRLSGLTTQSSGSATDTTTGIVTTQVSSGFSADQTQTRFAWALMAGTSYDLSANAKLDIGYRYLDLGSGFAASSSLINCLCGTVGAPLRISDLHANEFRIGIRWLLNEPAAPPAYVPLK